MKKLLFITACFTCISITGLHAQNSKSEGRNALTDSVSTTSGAREGKNVGKGTPLLQRQSGGSGADKATATPSEGAAPAAPAEKKNQKNNTAPANNGGAKPKE